jgi:hypothetical protein
VSKYIHRLISEGEHQQLDFKFEVSDSKKIARTLSAFANTDGGTLLIGVKDNGAIAGVRSEEEYYMIDAAASLYCIPIVEFNAQKWSVDGKTVLEVKVPKQEHNKLVTAPDKNGKQVVYFRVKDQNLLANRILLRAWNQKKFKSGIFLKYTDKEREVLSYLTEKKEASFMQLCRYSQLPKKRMESLLVKYVSMDIIDVVLTEKQALYRIKTLPA